MMDVSAYKVLKYHPAVSGEWVENFLRNSGHLIWPLGPHLKL